MELVYHPVRVGSRFRRDGADALEGGHAPRRVVAVLGAQALARLVQMGIDGVLGDAEAAADLLGAQVLVDQPEAFPLTRGEQVHGLVLQSRRRPHGSPQVPSSSAMVRTSSSTCRRSRMAPIIG